MRIALYARVSTEDKGQDPENQLVQLREWCARSGYEIPGGKISTRRGATAGCDRSNGRAQG
jgi:DNA invertase Pin-like site-specific DNA recombinase